MAVSIKDVVVNNGYIVHKPSSAGGIGMLFKGWDASGEKYIFGHNNGMIFCGVDMAQEVAHALGGDWKVMKFADLTEDNFETMEALATIFDD